MQMDLKKYIDTVNGDLDPMLVKVTTPQTSPCPYTHTSHPYQITFSYLEFQYLDSLKTRLIYWCLVSLYRATRIRFCKGSYFVTHVVSFIVT